jgi:uncharacterized Zn-binding protein involved in type VI secretion
MTDNVIHQSPHCHAPIHPPAPVPTPLPHPPIPFPILEATVPTVMISSLAAAVVGSMSQPCLMPSCVPGGPGMIAMGSTTVMIGGMPAGRVGDTVTFAACVGPIPGPTGMVMPPGAPTVIIGG